MNLMFLIEFYEFLDQMHVMVLNLNLMQLHQNFYLYPNYINQLQ